jgi:DNA-binding winged helix-turn-helix (wHTH) protein
MDKSELHFGPFRLEATKQLWRGDQQIHLRRQTLALLRYLAERPGQLVDKEELRKQFIYLRQSRRFVYEPPKAG